MSMAMVLSRKDSIELDDPQSSARKTPKRQCQFYLSWMKEFEGICRSSKGKYHSLTDTVTI